MLSLWALSIGTALATDNAKRPTDEQRGKELYERHCVSCHGAKAAGDGPATSALVFEVPDLQGKVKSDRATIDLVVLGKGTMPAFEASFESDDARRVLQYMATVHTLPDPPAAATASPFVGPPPDLNPNPARPGPPKGPKLPPPDGAATPIPPATPED